MQSVKRIEIIIDTPEVPALLAVLRAQNVSGYSVFHSLTAQATAVIAATTSPAAAQATPASSPPHYRKRPQT